MKTRLIMSVMVGVSIGIVSAICKKANKTRVPLVLPPTDSDYTYTVRKALYSVVALDGELLVEIIARRFTGFVESFDYMLGNFIMKDKASELISDILEQATDKEYCFNVDLDINNKTINIILEHLCEEGILLEDAILTPDDYGNIIENWEGYYITENLSV